jgi:hypothetical protein
MLELKPIIEGISIIEDGNESEVSKLCKTILDELK